MRHPRSYDYIQQHHWKYSLKGDEFSDEGLGGDWYLIIWCQTQSFHPLANNVQKKICRCIWLNMHALFRILSCSRNSSNAVRVEKSYTHKKDLNVHVKAVHQGMKYTCPKCENSFASQRNVDRHFLNKHEGKVFACHCGKVFTTKQNMKRHND